MLSSQNLTPCSLTFCNVNPYLLFKFLIFLIILVCLLFIHGIHLPSYISVHALSYSVIIINQSIHINPSAGAQNITGTYVIIINACLQALVNNHLPGKAAV